MLQLAGNSDLRSGSIIYATVNIMMQWSVLFNIVVYFYNECSTAVTYFFLFFVH
jgi:hypothetical protein